MRKFLALLSALIILISVPYVTVDASEMGNMAEAQQIATSILKNHGTYYLSETIPLYNLSLDLEAYCFCFSPYGYVIVNINDYSVPEFSPTDVAPYTSSQTKTDICIYNGPLCYYTTSNCVDILNLQTNRTSSINELTYRYEVASNTSARNAALTKNKNTRGSTYYSVFTRSTPALWGSDDYYCGVDGAAIMLEYLDHMHDNYNLLATNMDENGELQQYLINNGFFINGPTHPALFTIGINNFFAHRGSSHRMTNQIYDESQINTLTASLAYDYPFVLEAMPGSEFGWHYVIVYGYVYEYGVEYFVVNNGWGRNGKYISIDADYYGEVITINR